MLVRFIILFSILSCSVGSLWAEEYPNSDNYPKESRKITDDPYLVRTLKTFEPGYDFSTYEYDYGTFFAKYDVFYPTVKNIEKLIDNIKAEPQSLVDIARAILGHDVTNISSIQLKDNVYYKLHHKITSFIKSHPSKPKTDLTLRFLHPFSIGKTNPEFNDPALQFYKVILINSLFSIYVNKYYSKDYDMCIEEFYSQYKHSIKKLFDREISLSEFEQFLFIGNLVFPFALMCSKSEENIYQNVLNTQKYYPITYNLYQKLKQEVNFSIEHIFDFSPIFAATSLIAIYESEFISPTDKKHIDKIISTIVQEDYTFKGERLNIYIALAVAEVSKNHETFFNDTVLYMNLPYEIHTSDLYDHEDPTSTQQITFSPGGFLLRSVAINAKNMFEYIIDLHEQGKIKLEDTTLMNATINAVIYDRKTILKSLLNLSKISCNDFFLQYAFNLAITNQKFIIANMIRKVVPYVVASSSQTQTDTIKKTISTLTIQNMRFNMYRTFSSKSHCENMFKDPDKENN